MTNLIDFESYEIKTTLKRLLQDKNTKKNIIWATNTYDSLGVEFQDKRQIEVSFFENGFIIEPRTSKSEETQLERTRKKAEVFTPSWIVNKMNNYCDDRWFGREGIFNTEDEENHSWTVNKERIKFPKGKTWQDYVLSTRLEITCGEAPYLVSRYDVSTGEMIEPTENRMGILDRKLRVVNESVSTKELWIKWAVKAVQSCYGYEYQGDNLLVARINILLTFVEHFRQRWNEEVEPGVLNKLANIISWNIWQMDGLKDTVPFGAPYEAQHQISLFELMEPEVEYKPDPVPCKIYDWRGKRSILYMSLRENKMKKFDFVIGNPPYQEETVGTSDKPVYPLFMDDSYKIADRVMLITPARFLFNAGKTQKAWNKKMLNDKHFKVVQYSQKSGEVFQGTDIKGGVAITYRDENKDFGAIKIFSTFNEINSILKKVLNKDFTSFNRLIYSPESYRLSEEIHKENPEVKDLLSKGHLYDLTTNIFDRLDKYFYDERPDDEEYVGICGRQNNKRTVKWLKKRYINTHENLHAYKVFLPKSNGSGALGEVLSTPLIGHTQTFISIGAFDTLKEAENCLKYVKSKFARLMLGTLKITQHNAKATWANVPIQDFTENSDIDWSKSIPEIDQQLYKKYGLSQEEIDFIEEKVQEMK